MATSDLRRLYITVVEHDTHRPDFRGRLNELPLPGTDLFFRTAGRAGDTIVVQIKSAIGMRFEHQEGLRTLGLGGIDSAALVDSSSASTAGNIRHLESANAVRVIKLRESVEKVLDVGTSALGEGTLVLHTKYGTSSQPGDLIRIGKGDYVYSELSRSKSSFSWSTTEPAKIAIEALIRYTGSRLGKGIVIRRVPNGEEEIGEGNLSDLLSYLETADDTLIEYVKAEIGDVEISWKEPFRRFRDSKKDRSEITLTTTAVRPYIPYDLVSQIMTDTASKNIVAIKPLSHMPVSRRRPKLHYRRKNRG